MDRALQCCSYRRFGVEIELNTLNGIIKRPDTEAGEIPCGADYIAHLVRKVSRGKVEIASWDYVHNNDNWVIKHDMSCGLEINTPVFKGWHGLKTLLRVIDGLSQSKDIKANQLCSLHVHLNVGDLEVEQLASIIAHYIKCEPVFFDAMPNHRKNNRYCQLIGMTGWFDTEFDMDPMELISRISQSKYGSINAFHFLRGGGFTSDNDRRQTLEFRIAENTACLDPYYTKNWIRLLLHFIEITKDLPIPPPYRNGDPKSGLAWLDFADVYKLLRFHEPLSPGLQQVRRWFMWRVERYGYGTGLTGIWSDLGRGESFRQFLDIERKLEDEGPLLEDGDRLYDEKWVK